VTRWLVIGLALAIGIFMWSVDQRTDDTGVEAALLVASALALTLAAPRAGVAIALAVGLPIAGYGAAFGGNAASLAALFFSGLGAAVGYAMRRGAGASRPG
jgi:uncharacterized membrane protein